MFTNLPVFDVVAKTQISKRQVRTLSLLLYVLLNDYSSLPHGQRESNTYGKLNRTNKNLKNFDVEKKTTKLGIVATYFLLLSRKDKKMEMEHYTSEVLNGLLELSELLTNNKKLIIGHAMN